MNKKQQLFFAAKTNPNSTKFADLEKLAKHVGFVLNRTRGSHKQYKRVANPKQLISFQPDKHKKSMAKGYQVKQLINFIEEKNLQSLLED